MANRTPKISIFTTCKNGGIFLRETIESVLNQRFTDYEHIIVDGGSSDDTVKILREYSHIKWVSEPDNSPHEGFRRALEMTRGDYVMLCCVSDGYLSRSWFQKCTEILDNDPEISMVYGLSQYMMEDGSLGKIAHYEFLDNPPPQKMDFFPFWLATSFMYPEINYCVRADVYKRCFPPRTSDDYFDKEHPFLKFVYNFNVAGYIPYFLPIVASFGRIHADSIAKKSDLSYMQLMTAQLLRSLVVSYRNDILTQKKMHSFRDGNSQVIKTIKKNEIISLRHKVRKFRISRTVYFGNDNINFECWKNRVLILFKPGGVSRLLDYFKRHLRKKIRKI